MEGGLPHKRRAVRDNRHFFRPYELTGDLPDDDEHHLPKRSCTRMAIGLHGRHRHPYQTKGRRNRAATPAKAHRLHAPRSRQTRTERPIPKTRKMRLCKGRNRLLRRDRWKEQNTHGPRETQGSRRLDSPPHPNRSTTIPRFHRLLPIFRPKLLKNCPSTTRPHKENHRLALGRKPTPSVRGTQVQNVL